MKKNIRISNNNLLTGEKFSEIADTIYGETISTGDFRDEKAKNSEIIFQTTSSEYETITYKKRRFKVFENDVIYSKTEIIDDLFFHLNKIKNLKNLTLITSECDDEINKTVFFKKPDCISHWYSANVSYVHDNLTPIPLGLARNFSKKNVGKSNFSDFNSDIFQKNYDVSLYVNFQENTNYSHRKKIYSHFKHFDWATIEEPTGTINNYIEQVSNHSFSLCPWGNGIDTHRIFESLYLGTIPITKYHHTYSYLEDLPVVFVDNYKNVDYRTLENWLRKNKNTKFNFKKLDGKWWQDKLACNKETEKDYVEIIETDAERKILENIRTSKQSKMTQIKKIKTYQRKVQKLLNI